MYLFWLGIGVLLLIAYASFAGAPWVPARKRDTDALIDNLSIKKDTIVYELGCGDGRLVAALAAKGGQVYGFEINPLLWLIAYTRCLKYKNAHIYLRDFWRSDFGKADIVVAFLFARTIERLENKAKRELKKGSWLASYVFALPHIKPHKTKKPWYFYHF